MEEPFISIVSPVYKAESIIQELVNRIEVEIKKITSKYEIILVEDCSPDDSWNRIFEIAQKNKKVKGIKFSKNFGQHFAITAGLYNTQGDYVIVMDCDLQHDPKYIPILYNKVFEGYDIVYTYNQIRKHSIVKNFFAKLYNSVFNFLSESVEAHYNVGSFSLISRKVVEQFLRIKDRHRHYLLLLRWLGFNSTYVEIEHLERHSGKSSYSLKKLINHAIDGIISQSLVLLRLSIFIGFIYFVLSMIGSIYLIIMHYLHGYLQGWASLVVLLLLSTGLILMAVGVSSIYIGNVFDQVRERPLYVISEKINL